MEVCGRFITIDELNALKKIRAQYMKEITDETWKLVSALEYSNNRILRDAIDDFKEDWFDENETVIFNKITKLKAEFTDKYGVVLSVDEIKKAMFDIFDD